MTYSTRTHPTASTQTANNALKSGSWQINQQILKIETSLAFVPEALQTTEELSTPSFSSATSFGVGTNPSDMDVGDFNGDGWLDLVTVNASSRNVSVLLNNGAGGFHPAINFDVDNDYSPRFIAVGDFNGDNFSDLVSANYPLGFSVLLNNGTGSFNSAIFINGGGHPTLLGAGDFNNDGLSDLVTATYVSSSVIVLLNNGTGGFNPATNFDVGYFPNAVALGDFNKDGWLDLATANLLFNDVSVLLNDGTGSFNDATNFAVGSFPAAIAAGDFNNDGWLDLVTANSSSRNISVLLNNGAGGFNDATNFDVGGDINSVAVGDLNGDGKLDLVTGNTTALNVLLGDGTGEFNHVTNLQGNSSGVIVLKDFNGDGKPDIATTNYDLNTVSVLFNTTNFPPINTVPGAQLNQKNTPLIFSIANGNQISISDADAGENSEKVTLCATNGTLTLNGITGLSFITGDGTTDGIMTFTGTLSSINNALNGLQFNPNPDYTGPASLTITTNDQGNTSAGDGLSDTDTIAITVAILGTSGNDTIIGTKRDDTIYGLAGNDLIIGNKGVNTIDGGDGDDIIFGGRKADIIHGGNGNDRIIASNGNNQVFGDAGNDSIYSGSGNDFINGGTGNDKIWLGGGRDQVVIAKGNGIDTIYNFQLGQTHIALAGGLQFSDLTIIQGQDGALIKAGNELLATLSLVAASGINSSSFISV